MIAGDVDVERKPPLFIRQITVGVWCKENGGSVNDGIDAAKLQNGFINCGTKTFAIDQIKGHSVNRFTQFCLCCDVLGCFQIAIGDHQMRSLLCQNQRDQTADSIATADHQNHLAAELGFGGHALNLSLFKGPVFNAEGFKRR